MRESLEKPSRVIHMLMNCGVAGRSPRRPHLRLLPRLLRPHRHGRATQVHKELAVSHLHHDTAPAEDSSLRSVFCRLLRREIVSINLSFDVTAIKDTASAEQNDMPGLFCDLITMSEEHVLVFAGLSLLL